MKKYLVKIVLFFNLFFLLATVQASTTLLTTPEQDNTFLELRNAIRKQDTSKAEQLADSLSNYPIPSYVDYYRLKARLEQASEAEILDFIEKYKNSAIADRLRNDWLLLLGKNGQWELFDREYPLFQLKDDPQLTCYSLTSRALKGENVADNVHHLRGVLQKNNDGCYTLVSTLKNLNQFSADDIWFLTRAAAQRGLYHSAKHFSALVGANQSDIEQALTSPAKSLLSPLGENQADHETFILAIGQLAKKDPQQAAEKLSQNEILLTKPEQKAAWAQIAFPASLSLSPDALNYWKKADGAPLSCLAHEWRIRTALRSHDWTAVSKWIDEMPDALKKQPVWIYWKGRALLSTGNYKQSRHYFARIANQHHFYGQLALEELGRKIKIPKMAKRVTANEIAPMEKNPGFQLALKFFEMNMRFEGVREWNWQLRGMNDRQLLAAAEFARKKGVLDRMINTSSRTKKEMNFQQRFPTPFSDKMKVASAELGLDVSWVYGLIRQESRFIMDARSTAGASGLMQLMPSTARLVAKKIGLANYHSSKINALDTNILLGTNYLKMMMEQLDNSEPLATAGYNAGPRRPLLWRSRLTQPIEGAIFAETIPFNETRDYVKQVMSNATYYKALMEGKPQSLKKRIGNVVLAE